MAHDPTVTVSDRVQDSRSRGAAARNHPASRWIHSIGIHGRSIGRVKLAAAAAACALPTLALILLPRASVFPAFWYMLTVIMVTAWAGRGPGLFAVGISLATIGSLVHPPLTLANNRTMTFPIWLAAIGAGLTAAVFVVDTVLRRAMAAEAARRELLETATRSAEALALSESLVLGAPVGMCVLDAELRYVLVNEQLARITGLPVEAHHGRPVAEATPELGAQADPYLRRLLETGTPTTAVALAGTGRADPGCERHLMLSCYPVAGPVGSPVVLGMTVQDVTDELRLRQDLERTAVLSELAHRLAASHQMARLGTWDLDEGTGSLRLSPELGSIVGVPPGPASIPEMSALIHPDDIAPLRAAYARAAGSGEGFAAEARIVRPDGGRREIAVFGEPVGSPGRSTPCTSAWGVVQDLTDLRAAQRSAAAAQSEWQAEHRVLDLFQRAMLPSKLPIVPGAELAAAYIAATDRLDIGGDWYDALCLPDGRIFFSVGDVAGHDQDAAAMMSVVRAAMRAYAVEDPRPDAVLTRLNRFLTADEPRGRFVTTLAMLYDPSTARFTWANAGHPAPMLAEGGSGPHGRVTVLDDHDVALGLSGSTYSRWTVTVPRGSALCCYTDGLVERRGSTPERDQARLADALGRATEVAVADSRLTHGRARHLVDTLTAGLLGAKPPADDVCLFVLLR